MAATGGEVSFSNSTRGSFDRRARAFVLWMGHNGLGVTRSLGEAGIAVTGVDWEPSAPGFRSRYCSERIVCPDPERDARAVVDLLLAAAAKLDEPAVLIPAADSFVLLMSRYRNELQQCFRFALPEPSTVEALVDKRRSYELAQRVGAAYPRTFSVRTEEDLAGVRDELQYPLFIKPCYSHVWSGVFRHKGFVVHSPDELKERLAQVVRGGLEVIVQSIVPGPESNLYQVLAYVDGAGQPLGAFTYRKLRQYPPDFGVGTAVESVHDAEILDAGLQFFEAIGFRGLGAVEFKRDERDGKLYFIELNARLPQQSILPTRCGINFPVLAYLDLTGQRPGPETTFAPGVRWIDLVNDFQAFWHQRRRGRLTFGTWLRSAAGARAFSYFDWRDPLPYLAANEYGLKYARLPLYLWQGHGRRGA